MHFCGLQILTAVCYEVISIFASVESFTAICCEPNDLIVCRSRLFVMICGHSFLVGMYMLTMSSIHDNTMVYFCEWGWGRMGMGLIMQFADFIASW